MRQAELSNAQAQLIGFDDQELASTVSNNGDGIPLLAPADGHILRILQQSETTLPVGTPVMEIGNIENDVEVIVELLSSDAVQVDAGNRVIIDEWGGSQVLNGVVERVDPWGFTKFSALGVEEQRVNAVIRFTDEPGSRQSLGHGFRVEARIVVWENEDTLIVPSNALFRIANGWAVFRVVDGAIAQTAVEIGQNNGVSAEVLSGLEEGEQIVLYPSSALTEGLKVAQRQIN